MSRFKPFKSKHNLKFEIADWITGDALEAGFKAYRVGTVTGLWKATDFSYDILAFDNLVPGNGHLDDVFEWFEQSCKRDGKVLRILETMNYPFYQHLITKRGFIGTQGILIKTVFK